MSHVVLALLTVLFGISAIARPIGSPGPSPSPSGSPTPMRTPASAPPDGNAFLQLPEPPLPAPWMGNLGEPAGQGHLGPPDPYDIFAWNCHSNSNLCTLNAPPGEQRGPCVCHPSAVNTPAHHSFSWIIREYNGASWTCIMNYGQACCWQANQNPPDISGGDGQRCARWACGNQYRATQTRCLPAGTLVEIPGPSACVRQALGIGPNELGIGSRPVAAIEDDLPGNRQRCLACCAYRGHMWGSYQPAEQQNFLQQCNTLCRGAIGNGVDLGDQYAKNTCIPTTSMWNYSSRYEQCRGCCLDGAIYGRYPRLEVNSCLSACRGAYPP